MPLIKFLALPLKASTELEAKRSLLKSDEGLYHLYKEMVVSGLITAEEFWANRQVQVPCRIGNITYAYTSIWTQILGYLLKNVLLGLTKG